MSRSHNSPVVWGIISGTIGAWKKKYQQIKIEHRKNRIRKGIDGITKQIHLHLDHINADEAVRLASESYQYLDDGDFKRAIESIKKAQDLVDSTSDLVSQDARDAGFQAESQFKIKRYADAKTLWSQSLTFYEQAEKFALNVNDKKLLGTITRSKEQIREHIKECDIAMDHQQVSELVDAGDEKSSLADKNYCIHKFDDAKSNYERAQAFYTEALSLAEKKKLSIDQAQIKKKIAHVGSGIETVILGKTHALINEGRRCSRDTKFVVAMNYYTLAIRLLEENALKSTDAATLLNDARRGQITARLEQGKEKMRDADRFYSLGRYQEAKEAYEVAKDEIEITAKDAHKYHLSDLYSVIVRLGEICTQNSDVVTTALMEVCVVSPDIIRVETLEHDLEAPVRLVRSKSVHPHKHLPTKKTPVSLPPELSIIYPEWIYLGKGGFARVFRAKRKDGTLVVVKIPLFLDAFTGKTFIAEMQTWRKLNHPNIVKLFDFNIMPMPYLEEEFCDSALIDKKMPLEPEETAWILFNICEGLKFAHAHKIVHRDLKPANILFKDGIPKISDWGLSRILTEMTTATSTAFTLTYAAPEQITGGVKDERTDIWQLGVILYELLTGELPFGGGNMISIRENIMTKDPKPLGEIQPDAKGLDPVVMKCLAKEPKERFQSVISLQKALAEFLQTTYTESLKMSTTARDHSRSAHLTGALVMTYLVTGDLARSYNYLQDLAHYAQGDVKIKTQELSKQIEIRIGMDLAEIPEELVKKAESIVYEIDLGFSGK